MVTRAMKGLAAMGATVALSACAGSAPVSNGGPVAGPDPAPQPIPDQCGAASLQTLVGQPRTDIPVPVDVTNRRVTCTDCPLTEDYSPSRLNILYNRDTGLIERVYCG